MYRILIADDEHLEREALKFIINRSIDHSIELQEAVNGREAIVKARSFKPDIVFLDIKMPGIDGIEAARSIKTKFPQVLVVFLTAFNQFEYAREALHIGVSYYLIKPSSEKKVVEITEDLIIKVDELRREQNNRKNNELKINRAAGYLENEFIYALGVRGIDQDKFYNYMSILDLTFFAGRGGVMKILYESYPLHVETDYHRLILKKRCTHILKEIMASRGIGILSSQELSCVFFLLNLDETQSKMDSLEILSLMDIAQEEIKKELSLELLIGIGPLFSKPEEALNSFSLASKKLGELSLGQAEKESSGFPLDMEIEMEKSIIMGNRQKVSQIFQQISCWFGLCGESFSIRKQNLVDLSVILKHAVVRQFPEGTCTVNDTDLKEANNQGAVLLAFQIFLNELIQQIYLIKEQEYDPAIDLACNYIEANYSRDISLEEAAFACHLSVCYFSKLFKKKKKINFVDYLTGRRLKEAKYLLSHTSLSINEISQKIGYQDPNYFTRVFKRIENISPSGFRNKKILEQQ